jgi:hypothetical protein
VLRRTSVEMASPSRGSSSVYTTTTTTDDIDVSDLEDEDEEEEEEEPVRAKGDGRYFAGSSIHPTLRIAQCYKASQSQQHRSSTQWRRPQHQDADVSPVREDHASETGVSVAPTDRQEVGQHALPATRPVIEPRHGALRDEHPSTREEDAEAQESRDVARPLSFASNSPALQQGTTPYNSSPNPSVNSFETRGRNPRSSIAKEPMHASPKRRSSSVRNSVYNTTQIPPQKERVRYSWQSIQDEEQQNRPRIHIVKLFSQTVTASAGFPTGEAFGFSVSPGGRRIAAYNSARLYVLHTNALPQGISHDFSLKRRPLGVEITDDGALLAILADSHTINIYEIEPNNVRRLRTIKLDFPTKHIALASTGGLIAAAYEGGIEVFSLHPEAAPTDRRAVRSINMDRMMFSEDGSTLLGTTTRANVCATIVVSVPVFPSQPNGLPTHEELREAWCSDLLHPENIRNSSHAVFMRENRKTCNERLFAWNGLEDTFGILNVADMQYGRTDFPVVISPPLSTCGGLGAAIHSAPSIDEHGDTVAMVVNDRTIRLYLVPHKGEEDGATVEAHSIDHELDEGYGCPFSEARWVYSSASLPAPLDNQTSVKGRLIVTSPGGVTESGISEESVEEIEGGRIILFDFDAQFAGQPGQTHNLYMGKSPPVPLDEEELELKEQVNLVRRRTVNQRKGNALNARPPALGRSATTSGRRPPRGTAAGVNGTADLHRTRASILSVSSMHSEAARSLPDLTEGSETACTFEEPYVQGAPRSHASLQRAASNAQRHRFQSLEEQHPAPAAPGSGEVFLPLPEYTEEPNAPLPRRFRELAGLERPAMFDPTKLAQVHDVTGNGMELGGPVRAPASMAGLAISTHMASSHAEHTTDMAASQSPTAPSPSSVQSNSQRSSWQQRVNASAASKSSPMDFYQPPATQRIPHPTGRHLGPPSGPPRARTSGHSHVPSLAAPFGPSQIATMPRSLQRAYTNAISPISPSTFAPSPIGSDTTSTPVHGWSVVSSITHGHGHAPPSMTHDMLSPVASHQDEDSISPVVAPSQQDWAPPRDLTTPVHAHSFSQSLTHIPTNRRVLSSGRSINSPSPEPSTMTPPSRHFAPHLQGYRDASPTNHHHGDSSASLFPLGPTADTFPLRYNAVRAGAVAHPITAWHPPAPSSPVAPPHSSHGTLRGHRSRPSSLGSKSAFPSTVKVKKRGFFKKSRKPDPFGPSPSPDSPPPPPSRATSRGQSAAGMHETRSFKTGYTKSVRTTRTHDAKSVKNCVVM